MTNALALILEMVTLDPFLAAAMVIGAISVIVGIHQLSKALNNS